MRVRTMIPTTLIGVLAAFMVWAVAWTLQAREQRTYDISPHSASVQLRSTGDNDRSGRTVSRLADLLRESGNALAVDPGGDGLPGLLVIDPLGRIPWLEQHKGEMIPDPRPRAVIFRGSYCAMRWAATGACPLMPPGVRILGLVPPPTDHESLQFAYTPLPETPLPGGSYIVTSDDHRFVNDFRAAAEEGGLTVGGVVAPPLWEELSTNPLVMMSSLLLAAGLIAVGVHWRVLAGRSVPEIRVRHACGAQPFHQRRRAILQALPGVVSGALFGAALSGALVSVISQVPPTWSVVSWLALASLLIATLAMGAVWLSFRSVVATALKETPHA